MNSLLFAESDMWQVVHNPGTIPELRLAASGPDVTAIFEQSYSLYRSAPVQQRLAALSVPHYTRNSSCYMVHSVPPAIQKQLVRDLRQRAAYLFVTDRRKLFYESFGEKWDDFLDEMEVE